MSAGATNLEISAWWVSHEFALFVHRSRYYQRIDHRHGIDYVYRIDRLHVHHRGIDHLRIYLFGIDPPHTDRVRVDGLDIDGRHIDRLGGFHTLDYVLGNLDRRDSHPQPLDRAHVCSCVRRMIE